MSSEPLRPTSAMLESIALATSLVMTEESDDFVMVESEEQDDMTMGDDESYDYCEDVASMRSPSPSLSVDSDLPSIDPASFGLRTAMDEEDAEPQRRPRVISFGNDEDEAQTRTEPFESSEVAITEIASEDMDSEPSGGSPAEASSKDQVIAVVEMEPDAVVAPSPTVFEVQSVGPPRQKTPTGSRLSNKKRRKKLKQLKKAAAAQAAANALAEMKAARLDDAAVVAVPKPRPTPRQPIRSKKGASLAVACATDALEAYRTEVQGKKKGSTRFVSPL